MIKDKTISITKRIFIFFLAVAFAFSLSFTVPPLRAFGETTQEKLDSAQAQLDEVNSQLEQIQSEFNNLNEKLAATSREVDDVNDQIAEQQEVLSKKQDELGKRIASKYRGGDAGMLDLFLSSTDFSDFANNWFLASKIMESDNELINEVKAEKQKLSDKKAELEQLQAAQKSQIDSVAAKQQETTDLVNSLSSDVKDLMEQRDAELVSAAAAAAAGNNQISSSNYSGGSGQTYSGGGSIPHANSAKGQAIVNACFSTGSPGAGYCAMWVSRVYQNAGCGYPSGDAKDMYWAYCTSSDRSQLEPGMIIAVPSHTNGDNWAQIYGHVGIYIGDGKVMHNIGAIVTTDLDSWIATFGTTYAVKWGWA